MKTDTDFFAQMAKIHESVALVALDNVCAESDLFAIQSFMDAANSRSGLFEKTRNGTKQELFKASIAFDQDDTVPRSALQIILLTLRQDKELGFSPEMLEHLNRILAFARSLEDASTDPHDLIRDHLAKTASDPKAVQMLASAMEAQGKTFDFAEGIAMALKAFNYTAIPSFVAHLDNDTLTKSVPQIANAINKGSAATSWARALMRDDPGSDHQQSAQRSYDEIEKRVNGSAMAPIHISLLNATMKLMDRPNHGVRVDDFFALLHTSTSEGLEPIRRAIDKVEKIDPVREFARQAIFFNVVEMFPVFGLQVFSQTHDNDDQTSNSSKILDAFMKGRSNANAICMGTALDGAFGLWPGEEGEKRLKATLDFLSSVGVHETQKGKTPITHIATSDSPNRLRLLKFLLDEGHDPEAKDKKNESAEDLMNDDSFQAWRHVVNAHKARNVAHDLLTEISRNPSA